MMTPEYLTAVATVVIAGFTFALWRSTDKLWKAGENTARRQLRAYLNVASYELTGVFTSAKPAIKLTIKNAGKTPATRVSTWCRIHMVEWPCSEEPTIETTNFAEGSMVIVGPGQTISIGDTLPGQLAAPDVVRLRPGPVGGGLRLLIKGQVKYYDTFGDPHVTTFRLWSWGVSESADGPAECRWAESGNEQD